MQVAAYTEDDGQLEATRADGLRRVRVYRPDGVQVVLGRGSKPEQELHIQGCLDDGVSVLRRRGGGCAVVLDPGNVIVAVSERAPGFGDNPAHFQRLSTWLIRGLAAAGVPGVVQAGGSDLAIGDHKVAGACLHRSRDSLLYAASLLVDPDVHLMERYLRHPPREPDYRRGRSHAEFVRALDGGPGFFEMLAEELEAAPPG